MILKSLPLPPQSNHMYNQTRTGRRFASKDLKSFKQNCMTYALRNRTKVGVIRDKIKDYTTPDYWIEVTAYIERPKEKLVTKKNTNKKIDVSNRIKPLHDAIADIIGIDDRHFCIGPTQWVYGEKDQVHIKFEVVKALDIGDINLHE